MDNIKTGNLIRETRKEKGMTQKELAELLHITDRAVSKWERGISAPDISLLEPLAQILDITVMDIISGEKQEKNKDIDTTVKSIINYSEKEIANKTTSAKRKMVLKFAMVIMFFALLVPGLNGLVFGDGFVWRCIPAHITAEKAVKGIRSYNRQDIEKYISDSEEMYTRLEELRQQGVIILQADTKLSDTKLEDGFLLLEADFIVFHNDIRYRFTANGTYRNGKVEFMNIVADDINKDYPRWMVQLSDVLSTYNPG